MKNKDAHQKEMVATVATEYLIKRLKKDSVIGVGSGSTVNEFIRVLAKHKGVFDGAVSASEASTDMLKKYGINVYGLNEVAPPPFYVDGADEINPLLQMIKGGGGALTREKILASASEEFICIVTENKVVKALGDYPLPIEVHPMARGLTARRLAVLGGTPKWRQGVTTDNGNIILDVSGLNFSNPIVLEETLNNIPGTICNGLFAIRRADRALIASSNEVRELRTQ